MINCIIIDDELDAIDIMSHYVRKVSMLNLVTTTTNPVEALQIVTTQKIDLIFLDIQMPELSGIDFTRSLAGGCKVILTTAYSEFAVEAFNLDVVDYLLKPIPFPRFLAAVHRAVKQINELHSLPVNDTEESFFFVKTEAKGNLLKISFNEIDYIEAMNNYIALHQGNNKILVRISMKEIEDRLPKGHFIRIQKSFIVSVAKVAGIRGNKVLLKGNTEIFVGENYKQNLMDLIKSRMIE